MEGKNGLMTHGNIAKQLIVFAIPLLVGNLFQQLYNTVDSIVVGNFIGDQALAAVNSSGPIIDMLGKEGRLCNCTQPAFFFIFSISCFCLTSQQSHPAYHTYRLAFQPGILRPLLHLFQKLPWNMLCGTG